MTVTVSVTDQLLHHLVAGSHAEGTFRLAVAAAVEHHDQTLFLVTRDDDFEPAWQLPTGLVLPGETLLDALHRIVTVTIFLELTDVTGYAGHHDQHVDGETLRTFVFTATAADPDSICRTARIGYQWVSDLATDLVTDLLGLSPHGGTHLTGTTPRGRTSAAPIQQRSAALRTDASGLRCAEAAVELLINQQTWLHRADFVDNFIDTTSEQPTGYPETAFVYWAAALNALDTGLLPCSSSESQLLRLAASLAEGIPVDLRAALTGLDTLNTRLVTQAVSHTTGHDA